MVGEMGMSVAPSVAPSQMHHAYDDLSLPRNAAANTDHYDDVPLPHHSNNDNYDSIDVPHDGYDDISVAHRGDASTYDNISLPQHPYATVNVTPNNGESKYADSQFDDAAMLRAENERAERLYVKAPARR
jgi:hypothetical protein